jgi:hypothetical protein
MHCSKTAPLLDHLTLDRGELVLRLLVLARARNAPGRDRPQPGIRRRRGAAQALQGWCRRGWLPDPYSPYDQDLVTFEEGAVVYDHRDAAGFIRLNALRLRTLGQEEAGAVEANWLPSSAAIR